MSIQFSNIINGFKTYSRRKAKSDFTSITWWQEKILKHQDDYKFKTITLGKIHLKYKRPYEVLHTYKELFTDEIYRFKSKTDTPYIIDCGANIGLSVLYFKSIFPKAELTAFEPDNDNCQLLKDNISLNYIEGVAVEQAAVWIKDEMLYFNASGSQGSKMAESKSNLNGQVEVKALRLSTIINQRKVDFLKIDIEGAEVEVMRDCAHSLSNVGNLFVEYHGKVTETERLTELLSIVKEAGFKVYIKMAADKLSLPFVSRQSGDSFDVQLNIFCYK